MPLISIGATIFVAAIAVELSRQDDTQSVTSDLRLRLADLNSGFSSCGIIIALFDRCHPERSVIAMPLYSTLKNDHDDVFSFLQLSAFRQEALIWLHACFESSGLH